MTDFGKAQWRVVTWILLIAVLIMLIVDVWHMNECRLALEYVARDSTIGSAKVCEVCDYLRRAGIIVPSSKITGVGR